MVVRRLARRSLPFLGLLLALVFLRATCATLPQATGDLGSVQQNEYCRQIKAATERLLKQKHHPPADAARAGAEQACRQGLHHAPVPAETPVPAVPGCKAMLTDDMKPKRLRRRALAAPAQPLPFFAKRPGALPPDGKATIGGVRLPRGSRCLHHWATDEPVPDAIAVASELAAAFPRTGLWPVLWDASYGDPDSYMLADGDPRAVDRLDATRVLRQRLASLDVEVPRLSGLAPGAQRPARKAEPYPTLARQTPPEPALPPTRWILLLVPVNRPADVPSVLGTNLTEYLAPNEASAVVRSWEERFGAVPVVLGPGDLELAVGAPPTGSKQARQLVYEQYAFNPENEVATLEDLPEVAQRLRSDAPDPISGRSSGLWGFAWAD